MWRVVCVCVCVTVCVCVVVVVTVVVVVLTAMYLAQLQWLSDQFPWTIFA